VIDREAILFRTIRLD